jgi:integral membrane protein
MPLKYFWDMPQFVQVVGMAHGILFIMYIAGAWYIKEKLNWKWQIFLITLACSVLPFGPFYVERKFL